MEPATLVGLSDETYELLDTLGEGGFGAVYLARKHPLRKLVALKVLDHRVSAEAERRLWDEALVLASLRHPGIVAAEDLVRIRGRLGLVTEYVEGEDLSACIADGLPATALVEVIGQVAWALHAAAQRGVVHRDVKPQNVRIGRHGNVKLLDFGIASAEGIEPDAGTALVGTPRVMAPERFRFESGPPSDVFSLGCILWLGLTGSHFYGESRRVEDILPLTRSEARWRDLLDAWPGTGLGELDQLTLSMVAWRADDRPTAAEVGRRCEALVEQLPSGSRLSRWCRERWPDGFEVPRRELAERTASSLAEREAHPPGPDDPTDATDGVALEILEHPDPEVDELAADDLPTDEMADSEAAPEPFALALEVADHAGKPGSAHPSASLAPREPGPEPALPWPLVAEVPSDEAPPRTAATPLLAVLAIAPLLAVALVLGVVGLGAAWWYTSAEVATAEAPLVSPDAPLVSPDPPLVAPDAPLVSPDAPLVSPDAPLVSPDAPAAPATAPSGTSSPPPATPPASATPSSGRTEPPAAAAKPPDTRPAPRPAPRPASGPSDPAAVHAMVTDRLRTLAPGVQPCGSATKGRWLLKFSVLPSGKTGDVSVTGIDRDDPTVEVCVAAKVAEWQFDPVAQTQPVQRTLRFP